MRHAASRAADGVDKRVEALHGADQQGDLLTVARGVNGGEAVVAELGSHINHPLAGIVAELDVAGLVKHQRYRRLRHPCRPRNIVHRHFCFSLHPSSPFREFASYLTARFRAVDHVSHPSKRELCERRRFSERHDLRIYSATNIY